MNDYSKPNIKDIPAGLDRLNKNKNVFPMRSACWIGLYIADRIPL